MSTPEPVSTIDGPRVRGPETIPLPLLLVVGALAAAVAGQGGYYPPVRLLVSAIAAVALVAALREQRWHAGEAWPVPMAAAALAGWAVLRAAIGGTATTALPTVATLVCLVVVLVVMRRTDAAQRQVCASLLLGIGALVAATGWIGVALRIRPLALAADDRLWRATATLTYANAAAALLAPLALLAIATLAVGPRSPVRAATAYLLLVGLGATLSRAGVLAFLAGLVVLGAIAGVRRTVGAAAPAVVGAVVAVAGLVPSVPIGVRPQPVLAATALLAGLVTTLGLGRLPDRVRLTALLAIAAAGAVLVTRLRAPQWSALAESRATLASPTRSDTALAALRVVADQPLVGVGPGRARFTWLLADGRIATGRYAHNEYLQILVDLGAIGLLLLLALLAAIAVTVLRGRRVAPAYPLWAGAVAGLAALIVHSGFDFLWQLPAVPLAGAILAGLAGPAGQPVPSKEDQ